PRPRESDGRRAMRPATARTVAWTAESGWARTGRRETRMPTPSGPRSVGIDVSKARLDIAVRPTGAGWQVANDPSGIAALVEQVRTLHPAQIVLEATGGLEMPVAAALAAAALPVAVVNPRQVRDFAKAT